AAALAARPTRASSRRIARTSATRFRARPLPSMGVTTAALARTTPHTQAGRVIAIRRRDGVAEPRRRAGAARRAWDALLLALSLAACARGPIVVEDAPEPAVCL